MGKVKPHIFSVILAILLQSTTCDVEITENPDQAVIVTIINKDDIKIKETIDLIFTKPENSEEGFTLSQTAVIFKEGDEFPCYLDICKALLEGVALILDLSWEGWVHAENVATTLGVPYLRLDVTNRQFVQAADDFLRNRNTTDAALIFSSEAELDQGLMYLVGNTVIRIIVLNGLNSTTAMKLKNMRPTPSQYVIYGDVGKVKMMFSEARRGNLVSRDSRWTIVVEDFNSYEPTKVNGTVNLIRLKDSTCCQLLNQKSNQPCGCKDMIRDMFLNNAIQAIVDTFIKTKQTYGGAKAVKADCSGDIPESPLTEANKTFFKDLEQVLNNKYPLILVLENDVVRLRMQMSVTSLTSSEADKVQTVKMGEWTTEKRFEIDPVVANKTIKRFFKIGVIEARPFVFYNKHPNGTEFLDGFCVKLLEKLSELMSFDYRTIFPKDQRYGSKQEDGSWDGLIGDLVNGETDMIIASLTMTSEREEVVDFVAPHFDQSGISIVIRKQEKEVSLFKFMSVLEPEVWWCILGAIILTAIVLWLLDTYSPFSGRNKEKYPYKCRRFTLIESFWFALTSITPQGGGEPPKAVSGRILVAAYWLFVVLMLATFTANLAAFLTVERMQTPVSSLEELAKQSKINYTVVQSSSVYQYFHNMATAEEELYRVWKDMTLNASNDQGKYRVWDYPIKEQYNRILNIIKETGLVNSSKEGFDRVLAQKDGLFAFIDDASSIRYEVYKNCYLTEIGEPFAEQPYAIAVQSGSHLQEEISKVLLDLQKDRYFEMLYNIYWNASTRRECPNYGDTEGITLQSLGGVFIATLVGLAIGLLTLIGEIVMHKRQNKTEVKPFVKISHVSQAGPIRSTQFPRYGF